MTNQNTMKIKSLLTLLLVVIGMTAQAQQIKIVEQPKTIVTDTRMLEISKVTLSDTATVLDIKAFSSPSNSIRIASDTYLLAGGKKYMIRGGEDIELDLLFWMPQSGVVEFKLIFEPLPIETITFDFIGNDSDDYYKIYGVDLTAENKKTTDYKVLESTYDVDEQLFPNLIKPFKGKVILIDIWATWCGPCMVSHLLMQPIKVEFADKDVVFLYLAGEDSPEIIWENMVADISGSHYRLSAEQWDYLHDILDVKGVPTFIILDREGNQMYYSVGFPGVSKMRRELNKALKK